MTSFKTYLLIAKRYLGICAMYIGIFWGVTMFLVGNAKDNKMWNFETVKVDIAVYDKDGTELSGALYQYLDENQNIVEVEEDEDVWRDAMYMHQVEYILIIPEGFQEKMEAGADAETLIAYQTPGTMNSMFVDMKINRFLKTYLAYAGLEKTPEECYTMTLETMDQNVDVSLMETERSTDVPESFYYFNYVAYILPCMMLLSVSPCIKAFKRKEIAKRNFCSSTSGLNRNLGLTAGAIVHGVGLVSIILVASIFVCEKMTTVQYVLYFVNVIVHTLTGLGLAFALANFDINENLSSMFANIFALASAFLCGVFVPREFLSDFIQKIGHAFPAYWYVNVSEVVSDWSGSSEQISTVALAFFIQIAFAVAFLCVGFVADKYKKS